VCRAEIKGDDLGGRPRNNKGRQEGLRFVNRSLRTASAEITHRRPLTPSKADDGTRARRVVSCVAGSELASSCRRPRIYTISGLVCTHTHTDTQRDRHVTWGRVASSSPSFTSVHCLPTHSVCCLLPVAILRRRFIIFLFSLIRACCRNEVLNYCSIDSTNMRQPQYNGCGKFCPEFFTSFQSIIYIV